MKVMCVNVGNYEDDSPESERPVIGHEYTVFNIVTGADLGQYWRAYDEFYQIEELNRERAYWSKLFSIIEPEKIKNKTHELETEQQQA